MTPQDWNYIIKNGERETKNEHIEDLSGRPQLQRTYTHKK